MFLSALAIHKHVVFNCFMIIGISSQWPMTILNLLINHGEMPIFADLFEYIITLFKSKPFSTPIFTLCSLNNTGNRWRSVSLKSGMTLKRGMSSEAAELSFKRCGGGGINGQGGVVCY